MVAETLKASGYQNAYLESEIEEDEVFWETNQNRPFILIDALNFGAAPGRITLMPLAQALWSSSLSHRLLPSFLSLLSPGHVKKSYLLGIQPQSLTSKDISEPVLEAIAKISDVLK